MKPQRYLAIAALVSLCAGLASASGGRTGKKRGHSFSPDGKIAAATGKTGLRLLDAKGNVLSEKTLSSPLVESAFSPDGKLLAACMEKGGLIVSEEGKGDSNIFEAAGECSDLSWSPDGKKLYYTMTLTGTESPQAPDDTQELKVWDAPTRQLTKITTSVIANPNSGFKRNPQQTQSQKLPRPKVVPDARGRMPDPAGP